MIWRIPSRYVLLGVTTVFNQHWWLSFPTVNHYRPSSPMLNIQKKTCNNDNHTIKLIAIHNFPWFTYFINLCLTMRISLVNVCWPLFTIGDGHVPPMLWRCTAAAAAPALECPASTRLWWLAPWGPAGRMRSAGVKLNMQRGSVVFMPRASRQCRLDANDLWWVCFH